MLLRLGGVTSVVISSTEAAKEVLKVNDLHCCSRPSLLAPRKLSYDNSDVSYSPYGKHWREMRKICVLKLFSLKNVQSFSVVREEEIGSLVDFLKRMSSSPVDVGVKMVGFTTRVICRIAFGTSLDQTGLDDVGVKEIVDRASSLFGSFMASDFFPSVGWIVDRLTGLHAKLDRSFRELDAFHERVISEHLNGTEEKDHEDIVDLLLRIEQEQSGASYDQVPFTRACVKAIIMDILVAGVDTGAIILTWAMAELMKNPKAMKKVQEEVRNCSRRGEFVPESELPNLEYLKMVLKETLRLHPPAPLLLPRETMSQFNINGFEIYPKTMVQVNVWAIGRDPEYRANAEEFSPERFADGFIDYKGQHFEFLPFGAGRRMCPAVNLAMSMVELTLANLLYGFDWKLPDGMEAAEIDMEEGNGLLCHKKSALVLIPAIHG